MDLDFNILQGSQSDQISQELDYVAQNINDIKNIYNEVDNISINMTNADKELKQGISESTESFANDTLTTTITGAANVATSAGFNLGQGSVDEIINDNISAAISLLDEDNLLSLAENLENYTQQLTAMGLNAPEELVEIILSEIEKVLEKGGVIDAIKKTMQATQSTTELAKKGMQYATSLATITANIQKLLIKLNKMSDQDVTCIPTVKDSTNALTASLINQIIAQYNALKQQLIIFYNSMICTSNDSTLDNLIVSINNILEVSEPALDQVLFKYTGHTISEIRNMCNQGFALIGMLERSAAKLRAGTQDKSDIQDEDDESNENDNELYPDDIETSAEEKQINSKYYDYENDEDDFIWSEDDAEDYTSMIYGDDSEDE